MQAKKVILGITVGMVMVGAVAGTVLWFLKTNEPLRQHLLQKLNGTENAEMTQVPTKQQTTAPIETTTLTTTTSEMVYTELPAGFQMTVAERTHVYQRIKMKDKIALPYGEVVTDEWLDTSELGRYQVPIRILYEDKLYETLVAYEVVDDTKPLILNDGSQAMHKIGTEFDIKKYIGYADDYDPKPQVSYVGEVNPNQAGKYPLSVTITDSSGNASKFSFVLQVVEEKPKYTPSGPTIEFPAFCQKYAGENRVYGIDVSAWQEEIDFEAVKAAGCSFVIMRIASCYDEIREDQYFTRNFEAAKAAGLKVGIYIYTTANTEAELLEQTNWIGEKLGGASLDFPVVFDWEDFGTFQEYEMSIQDLNDLFELFSEEMERLGYQAMLYSSKNFLVNFWQNPNNRPVWLAHYVGETNYTGEYTMWQQTARGRISGITGDVDFDIWYPDGMNVPEETVSTEASNGSF